MPEDVSWEIERGRCDGRADGNVGGPFDIAIFPAQCFSGGHIAVWPQADEIFGHS